MDRHSQLINTWYDKLMFAGNPGEARRAARELVKTVLGDDAENLSLEEGLREVCREIRPSKDPREQARFEAEFLELVTAQTSASQTIAA